MRSFFITSSTHLFVPALLRLGSPPLLLLLSPLQARTLVLTSTTTSTASNTSNTSNTTNANGISSPSGTFC